ncbi:MAG: hypothetical protein KDE15_15895, partial [Erythrobacter sp.]|nr:hypothetical protein [Erythrobacter sp.]
MKRQEARGTTTAGEDMSDAQRPLLAALWMLGSVAGFTLLAISGREIGSALNPPEMMLYRSLVGFVLLLGYAAATGRMGEIRAERLGVHLLRNTIHFAGQNLW